MLKDDPCEETTFDIGAMIFEAQHQQHPGTLTLPEHSMAGSSLHAHNRSISSESTSSLVERTQTRTHPSLQGFSRSRLSPDSHASPARERYANLPAVSRRRPNVESEDEDESEELEPLDPDATEEEKKAYKRRQNTLAARRSRAKRAQEFRRLQEENSRLSRETAIWKERALMMERLLVTHGLPCPNFSR